jgi:hypothetical protein
MWNLRSLKHSEKWYFNTYANSFGRVELNANHAAEDQRQVEHSHLAEHPVARELKLIITTMDLWIYQNPG